MRTLPTIAAAGSLLAAAFGCGPMTELGLVKPKPSNGGIVHQYTESGDGGHANVYWFDTQAGPIVVDVPLTTSEAKKMRGKMIRPYRIYITEADPVRFGGLAVMENPDVPAYTTPAMATEIQTHGDQRLARLSQARRRRRAGARRRAVAGDRGAHARHDRRGRGRAVAARAGRGRSVAGGVRAEDGRAHHR